ncbi:MAG: sugar phosphate nucleotidyltransferase [Candidatus Limnocylindrales bacterium]
MTNGLRAVIQAGGRGTRLYPYSTVLPKALMPLERDVVVVDALLAMLKRAGCDTVYFTVRDFYRLLRSYCGDGSRYGLRIEYVEEAEPLGTIGPLRPMRERLDTTFFVTNSDVYLDLDTDAFLAAHRRHGTALTVAVTRQTVDIAYGVLDLDDGVVTTFREKPKESFTVSTGVYLMEPRIIDLIPEGPFGFDDLVHRMLAERIPIGAFHHDGTWIDIGRIEELRRAQQEAAGYLATEPPNGSH